MRRGGAGWVGESVLVVVWVLAAVLLVGLVAVFELTVLVTVIWLVEQVV